MARILTSTMQDAQGNVSYKLLARATLYPSRIFFDALSSNNPFAGADAIGLNDDPVAQDIAYNATAGGVVTFFCEGGYLKYAIQGNSTPVTTTYNYASIKPAVIGTRLYLWDDNDLSVRVYTIDYSAIASLSTSPLTLDDTIYTDLSDCYNLHAISSTEFVMIGDSLGLYQVEYYDGASSHLMPTRFMFPYIAEWEGSGRTLTDLAKFSGAAKLENRVFTYMTASHSGIVQGVYYDIDTGTWGDIFTAMPTDLGVSLCGFYVSNVVERGNKLYMCGMLNRTDAYDLYGGTKPYTLLMSSSDGITFAINKFSLISNLGYRFHATFDNDVLYLGNCNRICSADSLWPYDGLDLSNSPKLDLSAAKILSASASNLDSITILLKAGDEVLRDNPYIAYGARVLLEVGYETTEGNEYVDYCVYAIDSISKSRTGEKGLAITCTQLALWNMGSLSMPFYAEITGVSTTYESMNEDVTQLYPAETPTKYRTDYWFDMWEGEAYENVDLGISPGVKNTGGIFTYPASGTYGIISPDILTYPGLTEYPLITDTTLTVKLYGWGVSGLPSLGVPADPGTGPVFEVIIIHDNVDGTDEQVYVSNENKDFPGTYPPTSAGDDPIVLTVTGMEVGRVIKRVGFVAETPANESAGVVNRIEFTDNIKAPIDLPNVERTWVNEKNGSYKIPGQGIPYIMFSQRPYNSFNFNIAARFKTTVTSEIAGYAVGAGLVGLAEDGGNYILARYNQTNDKIELVKVRDGDETVLQNFSPLYAVGTYYELQFVHRDGSFSVYQKNEATGRYGRVFLYNWRSTDGYMCTSLVTSMKVGFWGQISVPLIETVSYGARSQDTIALLSSSIGAAPLGDLTDFPASGKLRIDDNVYLYGSKISHPARVIGPIGFVFPNETNNWDVGIYNPLPGYGILARFMDWNQSTSLLNGYIVTIDAGYSFITSSQYWTAHSGNIETGFWPVAHIILYADVPTDSIYGSFTNKVFVTGGFTEITLLSGDAYVHAYRSYSTYELDGSLYCLWFMGAGGEARETTVQDLCKIVGGYAGVDVVFPGNVAITNATIDGDTALFEDDYAESLDLEFDIDDPQTFTLHTNIKLKPDNYEEKDDIIDDTGLDVVFTYDGGTNFHIDVISTPSDTIMYSISYLSGAGKQTFRVLFHDNCLSIFQCNQWVTTVVFDELIYDQSMSVIASMEDSGTPFVINSIELKEVADPREAVYIDLETDAMTAIRSIVQERPVEIVPRSDGSLAIYYYYERDVVTMSYRPLTHEENEAIPSGAASDAIVYGSRNVNTIQYAPFGAILGLSTKLFRFPNLNVGKTEAAVRTLNKLYQRRRMHNMSMRPLLNVTIDDRLSYSYNLVSPPKLVTGSIIVEGISLTISNDNQRETTMRITGRQHDG